MLPGSLPVSRDRSVSIQILLFILFYSLLFFPSLSSALDLSAQECRYCHGVDMSTRHHLLVGQGLYQCYDCHVATWDAQLNAIVFAGVRDCMSCHTSSVADRHHVTAVHADFDCLSCHAVLKDDASEIFYVNFNFVTGRQQVSHYYYHTLSAKNECSGCHLDNIADEHKGRCNVCHGNTDPIVMTALAARYKDCVACHGGGLHVMKCGVCHSTVFKEKNSVLHKRHMRIVNCSYCHTVPDKYTLDGTTGKHCAICHGITKPYSPSDIPRLHKAHLTGATFTPYTCSMCHGKAAPQMHPTQCCICHDDNRLYDNAQLASTHKIHANKFDCANCHFHPTDITSTPVASSCQRCHDTRSSPSLLSLHGKSHTGMPCLACHGTVEISARRLEAPLGCLPCHAEQPVYPNMQTVHYRHVGYHCSVCHTAIYPAYPSAGQPLNFNTGNVTGMITSESGAPIESARVLTEDGKFLTLSRNGGNFSLWNLPPGVYGLRAEKITFTSQIRRLKIIGGQTASVNFVLTAAPQEMTSLTGKVEDENQKPIGGVTISTQADSVGYSTVTAPDGGYTIAAIAIGNYTLTAERTGFYSSAKPIALSAGEKRNLDFTMASVPNNVLCSACHEELSSRVSCQNKAWKKHLRNNLIDKARFDETETLLLGQKCSSTPLPPKPPLIEVSIPPAGGDLSACVTCHGDYRNLIRCDNMPWRTHLRKKFVLQETYNLAEITFLNGKCN